MWHAFGSSLVLFQAHHPPYSAHGYGNACLEERVLSDADLFYFVQ